MPSRVRTNIEWLFDWNGDGLFDHPLSNVTEDLASASVRWGTDASSPRGAVVQPGSEAVVVVGGIRGASATGSIRLYNRDDKFDPDNPNTLVGGNVLRAPVTVRQLHDGHVRWEGKAIPRHGTAFRAVEFFEWKLEGKNAEALRSRIGILREGGTLADVVDDEVPVSFTSSSSESLPLGVVTFSGARIRYYEALATLGGGWIVEHADGTMHLATLSDAHRSVSSLQLGDSYEPDSEVQLLENPLLVRTRCTLTSQDYSEVTDPVGVGSNRYSLEPVTASTFTFTLKPEDTRRIDEWLDPVVSSGTIRVLESSTSERWIRFRISTSTGGDIRVSFRAHVSEIIQTSSRDVIFNSPEEVYGKRDLGLQPWLTPNSIASEQITIPFLNSLTEPLEYFRVTYPLTQLSVNQKNALRAIDSGTVVYLTLATRQGTFKLIKGLVLAMEVTSGQGVSGEITLWGVGTRDVPPQPLVALSAVAISPFEVDARTRVSEIGDTIYVSLEEV